MIKMVLSISTIGNVKQVTKDNISDTFTYIAFGSGTFPGLTTNTALGNEIITVARQDYQELTNSVIISGFLSASEGNTNTIKEVGAKEGSTGTFLSGRNITAIDKTNSKELWVDEEIELTITQEEL